MSVSNQTWHHPRDLGAAAISDENSRGRIQSIGAVVWKVYQYAKRLGEAWTSRTCPGLLCLAVWLPNRNPCHIFERKHTQASASPSPYSFHHWFSSLQRDGWRSSITIFDSQRAYSPLFFFAETSRVDGWTHTWYSWSLTKYVKYVGKISMFAGECTSLLSFLGKQSIFLMLGSCSLILQISRYSYIVDGLYRYLYPLYPRISTLNYQQNNMVKSNKSKCTGVKCTFFLVNPSFPFTMNHYHTYSPRWIPVIAGEWQIRKFMMLKYE